MTGPALLPLGAPPLLNVAVLGYGYWGVNVARAMREGGLRISGVYDPDGDRAARAMVAGHHYASTVEAAIRECDAVAVCAPPDEHADLVASAIDAGKHVWVEKPIAPNADATAELLARARAAKRVLFVDHTFAFAPAVQALAREVRGAGMVRHVEAARTHLCAPRASADVIGDLLPHDASIWIACELRVKRVRAVQDYLDARVSVEFDQGATGSLYLSWSSALKLRRTTVYASKATVLYDHLDPREPVRVYAVTGAEAERAAFAQVESRSPVVPALEPLAVAVRTFARLIADGDAGLAESEAFADDALRVQAVVDAARESARCGGRDVEVAECFDEPPVAASDHATAARAEVLPT